MRLHIMANLEPDDINPIVCLGNYREDDYPGAISGCTEDLRPTVLANWDGRTTPFEIKCPVCGLCYSIVLRIELVGVGKVIEAGRYNG